MRERSHLPSLLFCVALWMMLYLPAAAAGGAPAHLPRQAAKLITVRSVTTVRTSPTGRDLAPVIKGMPLDAGNVLHTDLSGRATLLFPDGRQVKMDVDTVLEISRSVPDRFITRRGRVWVRVPPGERTSVEGPAATAFLHGTELTLAVAEDGTTTLTVAEGEVEFANAQGSVTVREAQQSVARPGQKPTPPVTVAANLPVLLEWTNALLPALLLMETSFISQDPAVLARAAAEGECGGAPPGRLPAAPRQPGREWYLRRGDLLHDQGRLVDALAAYDRAVSPVPEAGCVSAGRPPSAPPVRPADDRTWAARLSARRGQAFLELGQLNEAEAAFRDAIEQAPGECGGAPPGRLPADPAARAGLVMTLLAGGQVEAARTEAVAAETAVPADSAAAPLHLARALVEIRKGDMAAAGRALDRALAADPRCAQAHAWQSFVRRAADDREGALREARQAVALAPYSATSHQALADACFLFGRAKDALREARRAVALNSLSGAAHVSLANAELLCGEVKAAAGSASRAVALDPRSAAAQYTLGAALAQERRYGAAEHHLQEAVTLDPRLLDARRLLGQVLVLRDKRPEAERVARETLRVDPELPSAQAALGQVLRLGGRLREAAEAYETALAGNPRNGAYQIEAARLYLDLNDLPAALSHAQSAVYWLPKSSEAHAILGLVYDRQENQAQAEREYRAAISLSPENSLAHLGLVTSFSPSSFNLFSSGRMAERERAQSLLRDPAVLEQLFEPGVTSEFAAQAGQESQDGQRLLHRGQFSQGRVHDLTTASRSSNGGDRANDDRAVRSLQTDVAVQAAPSTQFLIQYKENKESKGLPGPVDHPDRDDDSSRRRDDYNLHVRQEVGRRTYLWLRYGVRTQLNSRRDPDALPQPAFPGLPDLSLFKALNRNNERIWELRLDHRLGPHHLTYGLADVHDNVRLFHLQFALPASSGPRSTALELEVSPFLRDTVQYVQDEYRVGDRGSLIVGAQLLHTRDLTLQEVQVSLPNVPSPPLTKTKQTQQDLLPYLAFTYALDARNLVRLIGNQTRLRPGDSLLAPPEAFILGEEVSTGHNGRLETYELDYERRFSPRTFGKLYLQHSLARPLAILPALDDTFEPRSLEVPKVWEQIAGMRFEQQITPYLSSFSRLDYARVEDRSETAYGDFADPQAPRRNPSQGLQVPFAPRWRGLIGLNYVDRTGTKLQMVTRFVSRQFTDVESDPSSTFGSPAFDRRKERASIGGRTLVDLRIAKEPSVRMEYGLTVSNLFNTSSLDWPGFPRPGRTWSLSIARRY